MKKNEIRLKELGEDILKFCNDSNTHALFYSSAASSEKGVSRTSSANDLETGSWNNIKVVVRYGSFSYSIW